MEQKKKILITGGLGYLGSHTAVVFAQAGYDLILLDNFSNSHESTLDHLETILGKKPFFCEVDLREESDLARFFEEHGDEIGGVIHFAAKKAVGESCQDPFLYYDNNILGTINLLKEMEKHDIYQILFSSSATVYDAENILPPFSENDRLKTTNPYGTTKLVMENLLRDMADHKDFNAVCLRYFNPVGAHDSGLIGENPKGIPTNLVPFMFKVAKGEVETLNVFGDTYATEDGTCIRDYIHVMDVAEAHLVVYQALESKYLEASGKEGFVHEGSFDVYNVGTGHGKSVLEMIGVMESVIGHKLSYKIVEKRPGDVAVSLANPLKIKQTLGWEAKRSVFQAVEDGWKYVNGEIVG